MTSTIEKVMASLTSTAKVADLQGDMQEPRKGQGLTTDFGVKVSDTDNWSALLLVVAPLLLKSLLPSQAESPRWSKDWSFSFGRPYISRENPSIRS